MFTCHLIPPRSIAVRIELFQQEEAPPSTRQCKDGATHTHTHAVGIPIH